MRLGKTERTAARKLIRELLALPDRNNQALAKGMGVASGMISHWLLRRHLPDSKSRLKIQMYLDSLQKRPLVNPAPVDKYGRAVRIPFAPAPNGTVIHEPRYRVPVVDCVPSFAVPEPATKWSRRATWLLTLLRPERQRLVLEHAYLQLKSQQEETGKALEEREFEQRDAIRQVVLARRVSRKVQVELAKQVRHGV